MSTFREKLYRQRLDLKGKRSEIREERSSLDDLEAKLLLHINRSSRMNRDESLLEDLLTQIVAKKDAVGSLQYEYDRVEEYYDIAEEEYNELEYSKEEMLEHSSIGMTTQSSRWNSEDYTKDDIYVRLENLDQMDELESQKSASNSLDRQYQKRSSAALSTRQFTYYSDLYDRESNAQPLAVGEDSEHDILEATFLLPTTTPPIAENDMARLFATVSDTSDKPRVHDSINSDIEQWESNSHQGFIWNNELGSSDTHKLDYQLKSRSDSSLPTLRRGLIRRRSRMIWWLFNTFGSSGVDYLARAQDKQDSDTEKLDDETWARLVYGYWARKRIPPRAMAHATANPDSKFTCDPVHVED